MNLTATLPMITKKSQVLVVTDEQGKDLDCYFDNVHNGTVNYSLLSHSLGNIYECTELTMERIHSTNYDMIVMHYGSNNLHMRHANGHISPIYWKLCRQHGK